MNVHPILVHFPIALLTLYAVFEYMRFKRLRALREWTYIKALFLFLGFGGALAAAVTGNLAEDLYRGESAVIRLHKAFAYFTIWIFGLICLVYAVVVAERFWGEKIRASSYGSWWGVIGAVGTRMSAGPITVFFALVGFVLLLITGALGGIMVYGPDVDIFTRIVARIILGM